GSNVWKGQHMDSDTPHNFRARLLRGDTLIGSMIALPSPEVAEIMAQVGFDWLFLDAEHGVFEARDLQATLQAAGAAMPCVVRLPIAAEVPIKKALDIGAAGVIVPQVNSAEQAAQIVLWAKYAPFGARGVGIGRAHRYGLGLREYISTANERTAVIVQAEHGDAIENIEAIVRVEGVDAVLIGPYDLSASLGRMGQVDHPDVVGAIERVRQACHAAGKPIGIFGVSAEAVTPYIAKGFTLIVAGVDAILLGQAARALLGQLKS
ncbi:MAG TPA: aldolase/citrate lyase family protein, partial [Roseiflexaceae bacterium]|nr:aldolase/citrate lyase family protein [Roseiflexaceae bacterium]